MKINSIGLLVLTFVAPVVALADGPYTICHGTHLCQIDLNSGEINVVGPIGNEAHCLVYHYDGFLYGINVYDDVLVRFDPDTGASTEVGALGVTWPGGVGVDCTVDESAQIWCLDHRWLYSVDPSTGAATRVCEQQPDTFLIGLEATEDAILTNVLSQTVPGTLDCGLEELGIQGEWIDSGPDNRQYAVNLMVSPWSWDYDSYVYRFDPATGASERIATFEDTHLVGLAFPPRSQQPAAVPTGGLVSIILLGGLLGAAGVALIRLS